MNKFKALILPFVRPFLPLFYYKRYQKLLKQIDEGLTTRPQVVCFFPAYHVGGAEKIHLQILKALEGTTVTTIITHKSKTDTYKKDFKDYSTFLIDLGAVGNYSFFQKRIVRFIAQRVNQTSSPITLFGCNAILFYQLLPLLNNQKLKTVDLLHAFAPYLAKPIESSSIHYVNLIDSRIVINHKTLQDYKAQYLKNNIDPDLLDRVLVIPNPLTENCPERKKSFDLPLHCLFVGRGSIEKRLHIFFGIAREAHKIKLPVKFSLVGNATGFLPSDFDTLVTYYGEVTIPEKLENIYQSHHILLTTSSYEGFPLTIMEALCRGLINISTSVGGIGEHLIHGKTGFLVVEENEREIINSFITILKNITENKVDLEGLSERSVNYAMKTFNLKDFKRRYREILIPSSSGNKKNWH
jgi:glycosyltransferase involved in cell wall biosynthesis